MTHDYCINKDLTKSERIYCIKPDFFLKAFGVFFFFLLRCLNVAEKCNVESTLCYKCKADLKTFFGVTVRLYIDDAPLFIV